MDMERKVITHLKALDEEGVGLARIATLNVIDSDGDITLPGAFGEQNVKVLPTHNWGAVPLGKARVFEKGDEVLAEFQINLDTAGGQDWHSALKFDLADGKGLIEWSYGFTIDDSETETRDGESIRLLKKLTVHEVSPVMLGAGVNTGTVAIKGDGGKSGLSLLDHIKAALDQVEAVNKRIAEVAELRIKEGRTLGDDSTLGARELNEALGRTQELLVALKSLMWRGSPEDAGQLLAAFTKTQIDSHLTSSKKR